MDSKKAIPEGDMSVDLLKCISDIIAGTVADIFNENKNNNSWLQQSYPFCYDYDHGDDYNHQCAYYDDHYPCNYCENYYDN